MPKDMLGIVVRKLVTLPSETLGLVCDLLDKLADPTWVSATKRFLRKENPWPAGIVQAVPFDPKSFLGSGWIIEEQDERSHALAEIDLSKVMLETCLKEGETSITGEEKQKRLKASGHIRLDARFFLALWRNPKLIPAAWKGKVICFDGTILRNPNGNRYVLCLNWNANRRNWNCNWLNNDWVAFEPTAILATLFISPLMFCRGSFVW